MSKATYQDGVEDGLQLKAYVDFRKIRHYIEEYMSDLRVVGIDEGQSFTVPKNKFADGLAKVIVNRMQQDDHQSPPTNLRKERIDHE